MTKTITRQQVIKALKTEPLQQRRWFATDEVGCKVCAVGAVLRQVSFETWWRKKHQMMNELGWQAVGERTSVTTAGAIQNQLNKKNYLAALSCVFESARGPMWYIRRKCISFVEQNFPEKFELTITEEV